MKLLHNIINPSHWRKPDFKSGADNSPYTWRCMKCNADNQFTFDELANLCWNDRYAFENGEYERVKEFYGIGFVNKSHDGGWPFFKIVSCEECGKQYFLYVGIQEPANSYLVITVQAITELDDS